MTSFCTLPRHCWCGTMGNNWYAVYVRSRHEFIVQTALTHKSLQTFLPAVERLRQWKDRKKKIMFPLFPGYLFVQCNGDAEHFLAVLKTKGVVKILGDSFGYQPVPLQQIESLKTMVAGRCTLDEYPYIKEGQKVRIASGPLAGVCGILVKKGSEHTVVVSIDLLQKGVAVTVDGASVEPLV